jgi:hypothetical protein
MKSPIPDKASIVKRNWLKKELRDFWNRICGPFTKAVTIGDRKQWKDDYNHVDLSFA